ncbi:MAG: YidC/Oxa1 family membrane protein insertase [bacterium]|nr:YidC/Oxa1 family membrane protein insertase [bacterium]
MNIFATIGLVFHEVLYRPLFNGLILIYNYLPIHDLGLAIILLTVLVRLVLYPLITKQFRSQKAMSALQPKLQEIKKKYPNKEEQTKKTMELYKEEGVHPASGCLPLLIQLPVLIALYQVFFNGLDPKSLSALYSWVAKPETINHIAFGFLDLAKANVVLAVTAGIAQFVQTKMMLPKKQASVKKSDEPDIASMMNTQSLYVMPIITVVIGLRFPAGLSLYWVVTTLLGIYQQILINKEPSNTTAK